MVKRLNLQGTFYELRAGPDNRDDLHNILFGYHQITVFFVRLGNVRKRSEKSGSKPTTQTVLLRSFFETFGTLGTTGLNTFF